MKKLSLLVLCFILVFVSCNQEPTLSQEEAEDIVQYVIAGVALASITGQSNVEENKLEGDLSFQSTGGTGSYITVVFDGNSCHIEMEDYPLWDSVSISGIIDGSGSFGWDKETGYTKGAYQTTGNLELNYHETVYTGQWEITFNWEDFVFSSTGYIIINDYKYDCTVSYSFYSE